MTEAQKSCRFCEKRIRGATMSLYRRHLCCRCGHRTHHRCQVTEEDRKRFAVGVPHICRACLRDDHDPWPSPVEPRAGETLRIVALADLHIGSKRDMLDGPPTAKDAAAMWQALWSYDARRIVDTLVEVRRRTPHVILLAGDLTINGTPDEMDDVERLIRRTLEPLVWAVVPGNHDLWSARQLDQANRQALLGAPLLKGAYPYRWALPGDLQVVGLFSPRVPVQLPDNAIGDLGDKQLCELDSILRHIQATETKAIVMLHHPPRHHHGRHGLYKLCGATKLNDVLDRHPSAAVAITGHLHEGWLCRCGETAVVNVPSAGEHHAFVELEYDVQPGSIRSAQVVQRRPDGVFATSPLQPCTVATRKFA